MAEAARMAEKDGVDGEKASMMRETDG